MLFHSPEFFFLFLPILLVLYYFPPFRAVQLFILIAGGLFFYAVNHLEFVLLLILSVAVNSVFSYLVWQSTEHRKRFALAAMGIVLNLSLLGFFKYGKLIYTTFFGVSGPGEFLLTLPLPIGISFYTFQGIGLLVDVLRNDHSFFSARRPPLKEHVLKTIFFISFFPHSIAGPIVKAYTFYPQIQKKSFGDVDLLRIAKILILGYFLKMVVADNIQNYTFWIAYPYFLDIGSLQLFMMMIGYSIQIFADFAGYSLIAIGIAALFGYELPSNFNFPYISRSFREFWQRWHMSLSAWLKEYLYFSLGGNRKGHVRTYLNLFIVMILGGGWHGAGWNYLAWGGIHGTLLAMERLISETGWGHRLSQRYEADALASILKGLVVFLLVSWAWLFFKLPDFSMAMQYTWRMLTNWLQTGKAFVDKTVILFCLLYAVPVVLYHAGALRHWAEHRLWPRFEPLVYAVMLFLIFVNRGSSDAFIYFQF